MHCRDTIWSRIMNKQYIYEHNFEKHLKNRIKKNDFIMMRYLLKITFNARCHPYLSVNINFC